MGISVRNIIPFNPDIIMCIVRKKGGNMIRDKFLKNKRIKKLLASMAVFVSAVCVSTAVSGFTTQVYAEATIGTNISVKTSDNNYIRWATPVKAYLVNIGDGNLMRVQSDGSNVYVEYYNSELQVTDYKQIPTELSEFGGFYDGADAYYIVSGQSNPSESADVECFRITKYDKSWNRITSTGLYDCNTVGPFQAGSLRMTESDGYLFIRTSHTMYKSSDGYNHQANVTIQVDEKNMNITDSFTKIMNSAYGYVSHSFNQFIKTDGNHLVAVDHGDAYPRSIALIEYPTDFTTGQFISNMDYWGDNCKCTSLLNIAGTTGDNTTNASVGGFEVTDSAYIVAASSIDQDNNGKLRNICILSKSKADGNTKINWITDYTGDDYSATTPHLVKMADNRYLVLWCKRSDREGTVYYTFVDNNGNQTDKIRTMTGKLSQCEPVMYGDMAIWYTSDEDSVSFHGIFKDGSAYGTERGLLQEADGTWKYYVNDEVDYDYTGLANNEYGWFYVKNGVLDWSYTGLAQNEYGWFYVNNGVLDWSYTGLAQNEYGWFYVNNGVLDWSYTGLAEYAGNWFYVSGGILDWGYTGLAEYAGNWFYVSGGIVNWNYTGLVEYAGNWFYVSGGIVDWSYTGTASNEYGTFYIKKGVLDWSYTGLVYSKDGTAYIVNGILDKDYTGVVEDSAGVLWYVENGMVNKEYNGYVKSDDVTYKVINGIAVKHNHLYTSEVTKKATCTEDGEKTYTCSICNDTYTESIEKTGHKYVDTVVGPTDTEKGYTEHTCSVCGDTYRDNYTDVIVPEYEDVDITEDNWKDYLYVYECIVPEYDADGIANLTYYCRLAVKPEIMEKLNPGEYTTITYDINCFVNRNSTISYDFSSGEEEYIVDEGWTKKRNLLGSIENETGKINIGGSNSDYSYIYHTYKDVDDKAMSGDITMNTVNTYILEMASVTGKLSVRSN